jgi:hypothetical protein
MFADVEVIAPSNADASARAAAEPGMRTAQVSLPAAEASSARSGSTMVSGPGQWSRASAAARPLSAAMRRTCGVDAAMSGNGLPASRDLMA